MYIYIVTIDFLLHPSDCKYSWRGACSIRALQSQPWQDQSGDECRQVLQE